MAARTGQNRGPMQRQPESRTKRPQPERGEEQATPPGEAAAPPFPEAEGIVVADTLLDDARTDPLDEFFYRPDEEEIDLPELDTSAGPETPAEEAQRELLAFELFGEAYAVDIQLIREIVRVPPITEVPRAPADVLGVMSLRGEVLPVFDLRRRLGLPPSEEEPSKRARVLVLDAGEGLVGVLVDRVAQVVRLDPSSIEPTPQGLGTGIQTEFLGGIGRSKDRMFILLDICATLAGAGRASA